MNTHSPIHPVAWLVLLVAAALFALACTPGGSDGSASTAASGFQEDPDFTLDGVADRAAANYAQQCASCHGQAGDGRGPVGGALSPPPTDFTATAVPPHRGYVAIRDGGMAVGKAGTMPGFASAFSDQELHDLVVYIRAFAD